MRDMDGRIIEEGCCVVWVRGTKNGLPRHGDFGGLTFGATGTVMTVGHPASPHCISVRFDDPARGRVDWWVDRREVGVIDGGGGVQEDMVRASHKKLSDMT